LYTRRRVRQLVTHSADGECLVVHDGGAIRTTAVVVATNAFTSQLLPELEAIRPFQSQIMVTEHAPDRTRGRVVTTEYGPTFFNQPRGGLSNGRATADGRRGGRPHAESVVAASLASGARASARTARRFLSRARRTATIGGVDWTYGFYAGSVTSDRTPAAESDRRRGVQRLWRDLHDGRRRGGSHYVADRQSAGLSP